MTLAPCPACARHVRERVCRFCGADVPAPAARPVLAGRITRAAVFSALAGCWTGSVPAEQTTPPDPTHADSTHADSRHADSTHAAATGAIEGSVIDRRTGAPVAGARMVLDGRAATLTDSSGRFRFTAVAPGTHVVQGSTPDESDAVRVSVIVEKGPVQVVMDLKVTPPTFDPNSIPKPYGAPPARRRLV